jgi:Acetyltransferase (GNAT) domain
MSYSLEIYTSSEQLLALHERWGTLYHGTEWAGTPMHPAWMPLWWQYFGATYGNPPGGLRIVAIFNHTSQGALLVGLAPFYLQPRSLIRGGTALRFLSTGESKGEVTYPEYLHPLIDPKHEAQVLELLTTALISNPLLRSDKISSGLLRRESPFATLLLSDRLTTTFYLPDSREIPSILCDISLGFEEYLKTLGARSRKAFRKHLREAKEHNVFFECVTQQSDVGSWMEDLFTIHQSRWERDGVHGAFASTAIRSFHQELAVTLFRDNALILTRLVYEGRPLALLYGFRKGSRVEMYQSAVVDDSESPIRSGGIVLHLLTMEYVQSLGVAVYDLLGWESEYKRRFESSRVMLIEIKRRRPGLPTLCVLLQERARTIAKTIRTVGLKGIAWVRSRKSPVKNDARVETS